MFRQFSFDLNEVLTFRTLAITIPTKRKVYSMIHS